MCGRFTRSYTWPEIHALLDLRWPEALEIEPSYNVAPTQRSAVVRGREDGLELAMATWGLVPSWAKDASIGSRMINARSETAAEKPSFRSAMRRRRCVVPISGFYEWQRQDEGPKRPHYIHRADDGVLLLAGLWERWSPGEGAEPMESFTILTTTPNAMMAEVHDRMPCVLEAEEARAWCDAAATDATSVGSLLRPAADGVLAMHEVGTRVNNARVHNDASLIEPLR